MLPHFCLFAILKCHFSLLKNSHFALAVKFYLLFQQIFIKLKSLLCELSRVKMSPKLFVVCVPDINECSELNTKMSLCKNGKCINTQGSYKCVCLPGFVHSAQHNYCVPHRQNATSTSTE